MIKIYSDKTKKYYDSIEDAEQAEFEVKEQENRDKILAERKAAELKEKKEKEAAERKQMAGEIEEARQAMREAQKNYADKIDAFVKKYGSYHYSSKNVDDIPVLFDSFFNWF
jgi:hypothetical protein